ncbi:hypothetical protein HHK36_013169 [Tetracentron sinense]|uniref:BHLH domain-containing protein n=1 Tax=Tetracentron sinense TaxID=13715 RepID=A0A834ZGK5_TETSI|nr:hypothetical protein HHK36_013169 [Tetracentron sinense]
MYQTSSNRTMGQGGLTRYGSAPGSFLSSVVDSVVGADRDFSTLGSETLMARYFSGDSSSLTSESSCKANVSPDLKEPSQIERAAISALDRSYGLNDVAVGDFAAATQIRGGGSSSLIRHSSSPAGFLNHLIVDNGFSVTKGIGSYSSQANTNGGHGVGNARLKSQLSFTRQDSLSQISEVGESVVRGSNSDDGHVNAGHSYASGNFSMGSWNDANTIVFSPPPNKLTKNINADIISGLNCIDSHCSLPQTSLEMATVDKLLNIQQDSTPCRLRAKRGYATHPRSIAERERRTRISKKMRKLQDLVPNLDKQINNAEMLDLAMQHIKELQTEVQRLNKDLENCICGCKQAT